MSFSSTMIPTEPSGLRRNEPEILLPGFDHDEQLRLDFSSPAFLSAWTRRAYTREHNPNSLSLGETRQAREAASVRVRYGNNITVLFRACYRLSGFYGSPGFWPAISIGFSINPRATEDIVHCLVRARRVYRRSSHQQFHSGATVAVDQWIKFIDGSASSSSWRPPASGPGASQAAERSAADFYENSKTRFLQDDAACMLTKRGIQESQRAVRKRPPSPTPLENPREAKRIASADSSQKPTSTANRLAPTTKASSSSRLPLALDTKKPEQAKQEARQEYPTPTSSSLALGTNIVRPQPEESACSPLAPPVEHIERKIRGIAQKDSCSPPMDDSEPMPEGQSTSQVQVKRQKPADVRPESSGSVQDVPATLTTTPKMSTTESTEPGLVAMMQVKIVSLEERLLKAEAGHEKDVSSFKALIASYETRMVELEDSRSVQAILMQKMQAQLALMESKPATPDRTASVDRDAIINNTLGSSQKEMLKMDNRLTALEEQGESLRRAIRGMTHTNTKGLSPTPPEDIQWSMEDMARRVKTLPTMHHVSEKVFQLEKQLRETLQTYQRNNDERVNKAVKDLENMRVQVRGLAKQFDKATACLPKTATLTAIQEQVARLSKEMSSLAARECKVQDDQLSTLNGRVDKLSTELHHECLVSLPDLIQKLSSKTDALEKKIGDAQAESLASLWGRVQNLSSKTDVLEEKIEDARVESQAAVQAVVQEELDSINALIDVLRRKFSELLGQLRRKGAVTKALGSSNQPSNPRLHAMTRSPNVPRAGPSNSLVHVSAAAPPDFAHR